MAACLGGDNDTSKLTQTSKKSWTCVAPSPMTFSCWFHLSCHGNYRMFLCGAVQFYKIPVLIKESNTFFGTSCTFRGDYWKIQVSFRWMSILKATVLILKIELTSSDWLCWKRRSEAELYPCLVFRRQLEVLNLPFTSMSFATISFYLRSQPPHPFTPELFVSWCHQTFPSDLWSCVLFV